MAHTIDLLITGFEPFMTYTVNPSWVAAAAVAAAWPDRAAAVRLPVDYHAAAKRLLAAIEALRPAAVLCMGLAPENAFRFEQIARKPAAFASSPGPAVLTATWDWTTGDAVSRERSVPARRSIDAGQYVCESTLWCLLNAHAASGRPLGFLHVPAVSETFPLGRTVDHVRVLVEAYLEHFPVRCIGSRVRTTPVAV